MEGVCSAESRVSGTASTCTSCRRMSAKTSATRVLRVPTLQVARRNGEGCVTGASPQRNPVPRR
eukprot:6564189-Alexandrium_andersonii.AAC.1